MNIQSRRRKKEGLTLPEVDETVGWVTPAVGGAYHPGTHKAYNGVERRRSVSKVR